MYKLAITYSLIITSLACFSNRDLLKYPELRIEGRNANKYIVNRESDYGLGHQDGCIISSQMSMKLSVLGPDSISGYVFDSNSKKPAYYASIKMALINLDTLTINADAEGKFNTKLDTSIASLQTHLVGYRSLQIDLSDYKY